MATVFQQLGAGVSFSGPFPRAQCCPSGPSNSLVFTGGFCLGSFYRDIGGTLQVLFFFSHSSVLKRLCVYWHFKILSLTWFRMLIRSWKLSFPDGALICPIRATPISENCEQNPKLHVREIICWRFQVCCVPSLSLVGCWQSTQTSLWNCTVSSFPTLQSFCIPVWE